MNLESGKIVMVFCKVFDDRKLYSIGLSKKNKDGSYTVTFSACGDKHIMWNLFKWGYAVEILAPAKLKKEYKNYIDEIRKKL